MAKRAVIRGATPLAAVEAVAFDTETTGLDTTKARIVQMAGVAVAHGTRIDDDTFDTLVDPRIAIPPGATRIHGIGNAMVRNAPDFPEVLSAFDRYANGRLLIGYSVGFDFAIMALEAERAGLEWSQPRALCMRMLGAIANPMLPDQSLETLASWLGIAITDRHSALGDAKAAADVFLALLPKLKARGIRTLAEAERACLQQSEQIDNHRKAGWATPVLAPGAERAYAGVDPYAYRHRVGEIMSRPVDILNEALSARDAIASMVARKISSVLVSKSGEPDGPIGDYGIITERDIMRLIASDGEEALLTPIGTLASRPLVTIAEEAFVYRAMGRMERHRIRHLAVRDTHDRLRGIVSARDLLKLRGGAAIRLDDAIEAAGSAREMALAWAMLPDVAERLIAEEIDARIVAGIVSEELRVMTRRAAVLGEAAMQAEGFGPPPCAYALLVLGSGGRGESLLAADQDNAIIFEHGAPDGPEDRWFAELGRRVADALDTAGIPYCTGGVMAKNAHWRGSRDVWLQRVRHWIGRSEPEDMLNVDIFFDMRAVHGSETLGAMLFDTSYDIAHAHTPFAKLLGDRLGEFGSAFGLLGGIRQIEGRIDLKKYGIFPIVSLARALAIRHAVRHRRTVSRLEDLIALNLGNEESLRALIDGHAFLMSLLLAQQSRDLAEGVAVSNRIAVDTLTPSQRAKLKTTLRQIEHIPGLFRSLVTARPM